MATLEIPQFLDNLTSWGPPVGLSPIIYGVKVVPATRLEKLPKAADWIGVTLSGAHSVKELAEQDDFEVAGAHKRVAKKSFMPQPRGKFTPWQTTIRRGASGVARNVRGGRGAGRGGRGATGFLGGRGRGRAISQSVGHASSLVIKDTWQVKHHISLTSLSKISDIDIPSEKDLAYHGMCQYYDTKMDCIESFSPVPLKKSQKTFYRVTPLEDDILREIVMELAEQNKKIIVTNDNVLSTLMTAPRSIFQWEIHATKAGDVIFLDWYTDNPLCDAYTMNETSPQPPFDCENPKDPILTATALAQEATSLTRNLSQVILTNNRARINLSEDAVKKENPFAAAEDEPAAMLYRYRKFVLNEGRSDELVVVVRTELDGAVKVPGSDLQYIRTFAVNEFEDKSIAHWRSNIQSSRGMILGNFIKTNACKACRWACMSVLSGAEKLKLGYVVRKDPYTNQAHQVLCVETKSTAEFAAQVGFNARNGWSIFNRFATDLLGMDDGDYMLVKEGGKPTMTWYHFEEEHEEEDDEENEDE